MKENLLRLALIGLAIAISQVLSAQVKLADSGVTKMYPDGTRITYFEMQNFPNSTEMREFVKKSIKETSILKRIVVYKDGKTCMYEAESSMEPDMVVDAINDALQQYLEMAGEFPADDANAVNGSAVELPKHTAEIETGVANKSLESKKFRPASELKSAEPDVRPVQGSASDLKGNAKSKSRN